MDRFAQLRSLRSDFAARGLDMRMHFHLRLRSPLSHYISYYLWTRVERQARNPKRFGSSFAQWARGVPNLQSELLLSSPLTQSLFLLNYASHDVPRGPCGLGRALRALPRRAGHDHHAARDLEATLMYIHLLRVYRIEPVAGHKPTIESGISLTTRGPILVRLVRLDA